MNLTQTTSFLLHWNFGEKIEFLGPKKSLKKTLGVQNTQNVK
jgi:hypothetical protein